MNPLPTTPPNSALQSLFLDESGQLGAVPKSIQTVDARPEAEFEEGHLPGAVSLTPSAAPTDAATELPLKTKVILVYGSRANDAAANRVAETLRALGYEEVEVSAAWGWDEWKAAGGAVAYGPARWEIKGCGG